MIIIGSILLTAWAVQTYIGISMALVAFACGLLLKERENNPEFKLVLRDVAAFSSVITPLFFVGIGMQLNLGLFNPFIPGQLKILGLALMLTLLAVVTKGVVGFILRDQSLNRAVIGMGMIPRGEVGLIFVQVGKSSGLLDETWSNLLIVVVILTTLLAPFLLKFFLKRLPVAALS
jgi:Kef-type K+ transport system membrane component KefB